jgi:outer membrane lipase/esterase
MPRVFPTPRVGSRLLRSLATTLALVVATPLAATAQFSSLTFFGDSYSDTGNGDILAAALRMSDPTPSPPYAPGVVSNGPVWVNYFAAALSRPTDALPSLPPFNARNFAIGTARTGLTGTGGLPIGMLSQLGLHNGISPLPTLPVVARAVDPTGLYTIFGGSNDVLDAAQLATPGAREAALQTAVANLATLAQSLYAGGARSFLMPSLANVGLSPAGLASGLAGSQLLGGLTARFNELLAGRLGVLGASLPGSTFYGLSLNTLFDNVLLDASTGGTRYGFTNVTTPCLTPVVTSCAGALFADALHPTSAAHLLIAQAAVQRVTTGVDVAPLAGTTVPEPTTMVLVGGGLLLLTGVRRRMARR